MKKMPPSSSMSPNLEPASMMTTTMSTPILTLKLGSMMIIAALTIAIFAWATSIFESLFLLISFSDHLALLRLTSFGSTILTIIGFLLLAGGYSWYFFKMNHPKDSLLIGASIGLISATFIPIIGRFFIPPPESFENLLRYLSTLSLFSTFSQVIFVLSFMLIWRMQRTGMTPIIIYHGLSFIHNVTFAAIGLYLSPGQLTTAELGMRLGIMSLFQVIINVFGIIAYLYFLLKVDVLKLSAEWRTRPPPIFMRTSDVPSTITKTLPPPTSKPTSERREKASRCPFCQAILPQDDEIRFCMECGSALT